MKRNILFALICLFPTLVIIGQSDGRIHLPTDGNREERSRIGNNKVDSMQLRLQEAYMWKVTPRTGEIIPTVRDSSRINFHQTTLTEGQDISVSYLGNIGSPAQSRIFFNRAATSRFTFMDAFNYWRKDPEDQLYLNTKIPYSRVHYQSGGGAQSKEERFKAEISSNFGQKLNIGFNFDYLYARGYYTNLYNKQLAYDFNASYIGDKYKMHAFFANNNINFTDNGGITDPTYITNPDAENLKASGFRGGSLDIPVRTTDQLWNRLRGRHVFVSNRYDIGDNMEEFMDTDSVMKWREKENYVSPASVILTTHYKDQRRRLLTNGLQTDVLYQPYNNGVANATAKYEEPMDDYMSYWSFKNTLTLSMNEGFRPWMKFGLAAFVEYDARKFLAPKSESIDGVNAGDNRNALFKVNEKYSEDALLIGGILSSSKGKYIQYKALAEKDILNSDLRLEGNVSTNFRLMNRDFAVRGNAHLKNISPSFFENRFSTKYWNWKHDFKDTRRVFLGGEVESTSTNSKLSGGVETLNHYIYYNEKGHISQESGSIQVFSLRLDQNFTAGAFHWDNQLVYQTSSNDEALPLPKFTAYSNVYLLTKIAGVMTLQIGADVRFHSKYYAPGYEALTLQFYNQREQKIGAFPLTTVYANMHMKYARFFVMLYNAAEGMGNSNYFSSYRYPVNPRILKFGLSWSFNN